MTEAGRAPDAAEPVWLPPRRYRLPWDRSLAGARGTTTASTGTTWIGVLDGHLASADAPDLPSHPQHAGAINAFARDLVAHRLAAARAGVDLPTWLIRTFPDTTRPRPRAHVGLQATTDLAGLTDPALHAQLAATGIECVKAKVTAGDDPAALRRSLSALRRVRPHCAVRLDANGAWAGLTPTDLAARLRACADLRVAWVEDPVAVAAWPAASPVPLAVDLLDAGADAVLRLAAAGQVAAVVVKPALCGSVAAALALMARLTALGVTVVPSSLFDGPAGLHALAALAAVVPGAVGPAALATHLAWSSSFHVRLLDVHQGSWATRRLWPVARPGPDLTPAGDWWAAAPTRPEALALVARSPAGRRAWTTRALDAAVEGCARRLQRAGVRAGTRVAVQADNAPEVVILCHAVFRLGACLVPLHPRATPAEVQAALRRARPRLVVVDAAHATPPPDGIFLDLQQITAAGEPAGHAPVRSAAIPAEATAVILYTSGTTGRPKGACLSYGALDAAARASVALLGQQAADAWLCALPLCHVAGLSIVLRAAVQGVPLVLPTRADPPAVLAAIEAERCTLASLVPTLLRRLLATQVEQAVDGAPPGLRAVLLGGAPSPRELVATARRRGWPVLPTWGLTETCAQVATAPLADVLELDDEQAGQALAEGAVRVGPPLPGTQVRVLPLPDAALPAGFGELCVCSPALFGGYLDDPAATAAALRDGWLHTGDLGAVDARGHVHLLARRTDLVLRGGENVYPAEVEGLLEAVPGVLEAAVVGLPDADWGEIVAAWTVVAPGATDAGDRLAAALEGLAPFKRPAVLRVDAGPLPRTGPGKLARAAIREQLLAWHRAASGRQDGPT